MLVRKLGEGGMGEVWLAQDLSSSEQQRGGQYALKLCFSTLASQENFRALFLNEAEAQLTLRHPHIVPAHQMLKEPNALGLVMEFVPGINLEQRIYGENLDFERPPAGQPMPWREAVDVAAKVSRALDFAHRQGYVHRDVKPSNILVQRTTNNPMLTDFGTVKRMASRRKTTVGEVPATVWYMSPEQIRHTSKVDHRTDVYSLGCVLYECLTGRPPFDARPDEGTPHFIIMEKHMREKAIPPRQLAPDIPRELDSIVMTALAKTPEDRFSGCAEFAAVLEAVLDPSAAAPALPIRPSDSVGVGDIQKIAPYNAQAPPAAQVVAPPVVTPPAFAPPPARSTSGNSLKLVAWGLAGAVTVMLAFFAYVFFLRPPADPWDSLNKGSLLAVREFRGKYPASHSVEAQELLRKLEAGQAEELWRSWPKNFAADVNDFKRIHGGRSAIADREADETLRRLASVPEGPPAPRFKGGGEPERVPPARPSPAPIGPSTPGQVRIASDPEGAAIWVDGELQTARTNAVLRLRPGPHVVKVDMPAGSQSRRIDVGGSRVDLLFRDR